MRSLIDIRDLSLQELDDLMKTAMEIADYPEIYKDACRHKILATMFFEPSTRTRLSFESAMLELGGSVISVEAATSSSAAKGESIADTARVVSCYADILAMRHPKDGSALVAATNAAIPIINAGDGGHCHPTQTLADLLTIYREKTRFNDLTVGLCGDLKYGRTVHSLMNALSRYDNVHFILIYPDELRVPDFVKMDTSFEETTSLEDALPRLDILYMTRIQQERFEDPEVYERLKDSYILTEEKMEHAKKDCIVMHPLPRVNEISVKVDKDPRACYFKQVENGKLMRMALIMKLLSEQQKDPVNRTEVRGVIGKYECKNPRCITGIEQELEHVFIEEDGKCRCAYCETLL